MNRDHADQTRQIVEHVVGIKVGLPASRRALACLLTSYGHACSLATCFAG